MKWIWITIVSGLIIFGLIYQMNRVAPNPMPGLTKDGKVIGAPAVNAPSDSSFEPLDLSSNSKGLIKKAVAAEAVASVSSKVTPRTLGKPDAPVKMYVFSSLTCGHCSGFHSKTLKEIEKKYVDTGKVFFTYIDFPFDNRALAGAMLARCVAPENYFTFLNVLFENQKNWAYKPNAQEIVTGYASLQGMSKGDVRACLADKELQQYIIKNRDAYAAKYEVSGTPTTVVVKGDETEVISGANGEKLEKILAKMTK